MTLESEQPESPDVDPVVAEAMLAAANRARKHAYAPYSHFRVGAAIRTKSGTIYSGCNVENAAFPEGTCAEAGAIAAMVAAGETLISDVLVVAGGKRVVIPCGGCRQKLAEFSRPEARVYLADPSGVVAVTTVGSLIPGAFSADHLAADS
ncbi:MAG: cytidine deaminase [Rhodobacteraceae bacterium]|nr:cytidine deaminase [Paracoccaceae bacterium]